MLATVRYWLNSLRVLVGSSFIRDTSTLLIGNLSARVVPLLLTPLLTRVYSPANFGQLAVFLSITSILSVFFSLRYEMAILLPRNNDKAKDILNLVSYLSLFFVLVVSSFLMCFKEDIQWISDNKLIEFAVFIPICAWLVCNIKAYNMFNNRNLNYKRMSLATVLQSLTTPIVQLICSFSIISGGLIYGAVVGYFTGLSYLLIMTKKSFSRIGIFDRKKLLEVANKYKKFPTYSLWGAVLDTLSIELPIFFITRSYGGELTGLFSFTFRMVNLPMALVSSSLVQVSLRKITDVHKSNPKELSGIILKIGIGLVLVAFPVVFLLSVWGENLFYFLFGNKWVEAGKISGLLVLIAGVRFVVSPLSGVLVIEEHIKKAMIWKTIYFMTTITLLHFGTKIEFYDFLVMFVIHEVLLYSLYLTIIIRSTRYVGG